MLLTITTTRAPATDLGYLLHKHPDRLQSFAVSAGEAHVFYPEATPERCTAALLLEVDPIALVRGPAGKNSKHSDGELAPYVNDRPYAASSMLAVAIKEAFRTALTGRCDARPELAAERIPLTIRVPALRCRGGETLAHRVFAPLGWRLDARSQPLRPAGRGDSPYLDLRLTGELRLADALNHLYVLLPVLDDAKHYWVSTEEVDKLIRAGGDWLAGHPEKEHHAQRRVQRALPRDHGPRRAAAPGPPLRVDPRRVPRLGRASGRQLPVPGPLPARRPRTPRDRPAHPAGCLLPGRSARIDRAMTEPSPSELAVPELSLVVLVGVTGSGKSTFARAHFRPTEVISSDFCRGLVADDENDQSATPAAFELLHYIAGKRLAAGRLTVVDATNLARLRQRGLSHKRSLALREYALGLEALDRVARGEPLWRVHECVFAVLALESEPVDPRL